MAEDKVAAAGAGATVLVVTMDMVNQAIVETLKGCAGIEVVTAMESRMAGLEKALALIPEELVTETLLGEKLNGYVTSSQLVEATQGMYTADQLNAALVEAIGKGSVIQHMDALNQSALETAKAARGPIDAKYLKGLSYRTSRPRKGGPGDDDSTVHETVTRDLTPADVLDWTDQGDKISFVTGDGQRVSVPK